MTFEQMLQSPFGFPIFFAALWLVVTSVLSLMSGWRSLQARFPDRDDEVLDRVVMASGSMGAGVNYNGCLTLSVCRTGLRVSVWRILGPFDRPFFVPWEQVSVERRSGFLLKRATLWFGSPPVGQLTISGGLADRLARDAEGRWPERLATARNAPIVS